MALTSRSSNRGPAIRIVPLVRGSGPVVILATPDGVTSSHAAEFVEISRHMHAARPMITTTSKILPLMLCAACSGGSGSADAAPDIDNGTCGAMLRLTGEYVDWDNDTLFCGIFNAQLTVQGGGGPHSLPPNGRIDICVPDQPTTLIDIAPPAAPPQCLVDRTRNYTLPALAVVSKAVILAGVDWSGRNFVQGRETVQAGKAHVFVHISGPARAVSLDAAHSHGPIQAVVTDTWAPGNTGHEVFIPDVDPAGGTAMLSVVGGAIGAGAIPLMADKITTLTVVTQ